MKILKKNRKETGVALIAVMLTLLLITAMAAAIIILANTETNTSANFKDEQRAFFAAKAGIEEARDRLVTSYVTTGAITSGYVLTTLPTTLAGSGSTGVLYITNPLGSETVAPWCGSSNPISTACSNQYPDDELCNETLSGTSITCTTDTTTGKKYASGSYYLTTASSSSIVRPSSGPVLDWKWARITLKQNNGFGSSYAVNGNSGTASRIYWNGNNECVQTVSNAATCKMQVYVITALAVTPSGSRRMVQMEVAQDQLDFNAPAALTLDGTNDSFSGGNSQNYTIDGNNHTGCGVTSTGGTPVPAVGVSTGAKGTPNTGEVNTVVNGIPNGRTGNYTGLGTTPDVENVSSSYSSAINAQYDLSTVTGLQNMVSAVKTAITQPVITGPAQYSGPAAALSSSSGNPQVVYVNGDLTLTGNGTGYGILVVTGTLTVKGNVQWNGLVLVVGNGNLQMDGTNTFYGAVLIAKTKDSSGNLLTTPGAPTFNVNGGGNSSGGVFYSANCLGQNSQLTTFHSVSFRELMN
jgi:Tfp pilus assembly protein PilX